MVDEVKLFHCYFEGYSKICRTGNVELIKKFINIFHFVKNRQKLLVYGMVEAIKSKNIEAIKLLIENKPENWCFVRLLEHANYKIMKYFLGFNENCANLKKYKKFLKQLIEFYELKYLRIEKILKPPKNAPKYKLARRRRIKKY